MLSFQVRCLQPKQGISLKEKRGDSNLIIMYSEIAVLIKFLHIKTGQQLLEYFKQLVATYRNTGYIKIYFKSRSN